MLKKKIFSIFASVVMVCNALIIVPFSSFANEENICTYTYDNYQVSYDITNSWGNTKSISVTLSNTSDSTIENWMLYFDPNGQVNNLVNAQEAQTSTGITYFRNSGYNSNINPHSSISFSYMVDNCETPPESFTLCQKRIEKESGYNVTLQVNQSWGSFFNGEITIQNNTDMPIESWELIFDTNFTITEITNSWAADVTELEPYSYKLKGTYTGTVYSNSSVSLGFNGVKSHEPMITDYSITEVMADEEIILSAKSNYKTNCNNLINEQLYAEASYNSENHNIDISWNATARGDSFEVYISDNNRDYELYCILDGQTFDLKYPIDNDFVVKYIKIKQNMVDNKIIYSNICYAVYTSNDMEWMEYVRNWKISADNQILSKINKEENPYLLSIEFNAAGVPDIHLTVSKSSYSNAISNDYILGDIPELYYNDDLSVKDVIIKFKISNDFLNNELGTLETNSEFSGIKRFNIFKYFEDINMLLPIETKFDLDNNVVYTEVDELGTYCIVDMEKWLSGFNIDTDDFTNSSNSSKSSSNYLQNEIAYQLISNEHYEDTGNSPIIISSDECKFNDLKLTEKYSNTSEETTISSDDPIDIVFLLQSAGVGLAAYESQKQMILDVSDKIFNSNKAARIYIIGYKHNEAFFLKNNSSEVNYFSSKAEMDCFDDYSYEIVSEGYVNRSPAYELLMNNIKFRENSHNFVFTLYNSSTDCQKTDQLDICENLEINYSELLAEGTMYLTSKRAVDVLNAVIKSNGICIICNENTSDVIYVIIWN